MRTISAWTGSSVGSGSSARVLLCCTPIRSMPVARFREWLATVDVAELSDRERVDLVAELERVKGARPQRRRG